MSYYEDVVLVCEENAYQKFCYAYSNLKLLPVVEKKENNNYSYYILKWEWVNRFWDSNIGIAIRNVMKELDNYQSTDSYGYKVISIGEDYAVEKNSNEGGAYVFEDFDIITKFQLDFTPQTE